MSARFWVPADNPSAYMDLERQCQSCFENEHSLLQ